MADEDQEQEANEAEEGEELEAEGAEGEEAEESVKKKSDGHSAEGAAGGPSQKFIVMVMAINVVVLATVAILVWMNLSKRQTEVTLKDVKEATESASGEHGGGGGEHGGGGEASDAGEAKFIKESFTVNLADSAGSRFAKVDVEIEVADDFVREEISRLRPRIRDFIVVVLSSKTYDQIASVDGRDFLREEIRNKINGYLTKGQIKNVYFTQFIIQ